LGLWLYRLLRTLPLPQIIQLRCKQKVTWVLKPLTLISMVQEQLPGRYPTLFKRSPIRPHNKLIASESGTTVAVGDSTTKCASGYKQSRWLSCNGGYFDFATGSNLITLQARGNQGTENVDLIVNGSEIASWPLSNSNQTFEYRTNQNVDSIQVRNSNGGWPNAVVVDHVELNGKRYESEDASTLSYGSWDSAYGCAEGYKQSKWLSCDGGYFDYALDSNLITVRARGNQGTENVDLIVNGSEVASWPLSNSNQTFEYRINQNVDSIKVRNNNGGWPNAVVVEYVELNGKRYESEDASTRSYGSWDSVYGCAEGYKQSKWLSCDGGYFQYAIADDADNTTPLVIFDTDMGPDIDDAVALALLHSYQDTGKIEIAAVTVSRDSVNAARYIDAVNTHYGHPDIPIGLYRGGTVLADADLDRFTELAASYSYDIDSSPIEDSFKVIRRVLANAEGRPVMVIQTGFSGSLSALMDSTTDAYSSLSGPDLVASTVDTLYFMGARFDGSSDAEFNIKKDISSARNLFDKWPGKIAVFPWDVGAKLFYPYDRGIRDKFANGHIIRTAYENETLKWHRDLDRNPPADPTLYNMASWDLNAVMHAIEPEKNYFKQGKKGTVIWLNLSQLYRVGFITISATDFH